MASSTRTQVMRGFFAAGAFFVSASGWCMGARPAKLELDNVQVFEDLTLKDSKGKPVTINRSNDPMGHADMRTVRFKGNKLELEVGDAVVPFLLPEKIKLTSDGNPDDINTLKAGDTATGQNVSLAIRKARPMESSSFDYDSTEACSGTHTRTVCHDAPWPQGRYCEDISITWYGERSVTRHSSEYKNFYLLEILNVHGGTALSAEFTTLDTYNYTTNPGPCLEKSWNRSEPQPLFFPGGHQIVSYTPDPLAP